MKVILTLHKSVNKIDKRSSTIKQLCWENTATKMRTFNQIWKTKSVYSKEEGTSAQTRSTRKEDDKQY